MQITKTKLDGVLLIKPEIFEDFRGQYVETYNEEMYAKAGITVKFVQDDISVSSRSPSTFVAWRHSRPSWKISIYCRGLIVIRLTTKVTRCRRLRCSAAVVVPETDSTRTPRRSDRRSAAAAP